MAKHQRADQFGKANDRRILPPLPHRSWTLANRPASPRGLSPNEAEQFLTRFWETIDA